MELLCSCSAPKGERILVLGDSNGAASHGWVGQLQKLRPRDIFCNLSIYGNTIGFDNLDLDTLNTLRNIESYLRRANEQMGGIDRILIWLGSNDCKAVFAARQEEIPVNLGLLLGLIRDKANMDKTKRILFIAPSPMAEDSLMEEKYHGGRKRLKQLIPMFKEVVDKHHCSFLNLHDSLWTDYAKLNSDGVHLTKDGACRAASIINQYLNNNFP